MGIKLQLRIWKYVFVVTLLEMECIKLQSREEQIMEAMEAHGVFEDDDDDENKLKDEDGNPTVGFLRGK